KTLEEHEEHVRRVLEVLRKEKLFAKESKCELFKTEVEFLGHLVGRGGVRMMEDKVKAVAEWPVPSKVGHVRAFLGTAGYYHKSLQYFKTQPQLSGRQSRWKDVIANFDFDIEYIEGKDNSVADGLSRRPDHACHSSELLTVAPADSAAASINSVASLQEDIR